MIHRFFILLCLVGLPVSVAAYGPRSVTSSGVAVKWETPVRLDLESDLDVRGKDVSALIRQGLNLWADLSESDVTFSENSLSADVDQTNVCCYLYDSAACPKGPTTDGKNPIVVDDDGQIVAKFFGTSNRYATLGFAAVISYDDTTGKAIKGEAVFNAACLAGVEEDGCKTANLSFSEDDFVSFIVHEMGHFLGLNHSQVNLDEADDSDTSNDDKITTMYAFFIQGNGANFKTPERDDQVGLAFLYPSSTFSSSTVTVSGTVFDTNGTKEFACANLIARNSTSSKSRTDAISFVSGQMCPDGTFNGTCDGNYEIRGLSAGETYAISVEPISKDFQTSSGIPPCESTAQQPTFTKATRLGTVSGSAGEAVAGIDFTLTNTSGNVNSLVLPALDTALETLSDDPQILAIEAKSATDSCSTSSSTGTTSGSDSSSSGCSLIRSMR